MQCDITHMIQSGTNAIFPTLVYIEGLINLTLICRRFHRRYVYITICRGFAAAVIIAIGGAPRHP